jgi:hypothetical protein
MPMETLRSNSKPSIPMKPLIDQLFFASSGDLIRPLRGTFVYTALAFAKVGKAFGIRFELVGISQYLLLVFARPRE